MFRNFIKKGLARRLSHIRKQIAALSKGLLAPASPFTDLLLHSRDLKLGVNAERPQNAIGRVAIAAWVGNGCFLAIRHLPDFVATFGLTTKRATVVFYEFGQRPIKILSHYLG